MASLLLRIRLIKAFRQQEGRDRSVDMANAMENSNNVVAVVVAVAAITGTTVVVAVVILRKRYRQVFK
jgi:hypothetical protein